MGREIKEEKKEKRGTRGRNSVNPNNSCFIRVYFYFHYGYFHSRRFSGYYLHYLNAFFSNTTLNFRPCFFFPRKVQGLPSLISLLGCASLTSSFFFFFLSFNSILSCSAVRDPEVSWWTKKFLKGLCIITTSNEFFSLVYTKCLDILSYKPVQ